MTHYHLKTISIACFTLFLSLQAFAAEQISKSALSAKFKEIVPFEVLEINEHETGLYEVVADRGIFYASKDGKHVFSGNVHELKVGLPNLTERKKSQVASNIIAHLSSTFVTYPATNPKHEILVFFDTSCGYCHKLHKEIADYNALGITVHYALYPRSGLTMPNGQPSDTYLALSSVSCAPNKELAMNTLVNGQTISPSKCDSQVANHYQLGQWLGVGGTPAIFNMSGNSVANGYLPAARLINVLEGAQNG